MIPLMAVTMNLSARLTRSFLRWFFRYGDGVAKMSVLACRTASLMSLVNTIRDVSKCTLERYDGLCSRRRKSSMASWRRIYHTRGSALVPSGSPKAAPPFALKASSTIFAMAVAQLPLPNIATFPNMFGVEGG